MLENAPRTSEEALEVLRKEAKYRKSPHYLTLTKQYVSNNKCPPHLLINKAAQIAALKSSGYTSKADVIEQYVYVVRRMTLEQRSEIFFLAANDKLFKPYRAMIGESIITNLVNRKNAITKFTDVSLD